ncbi:M64 family metallopeptidase [Salmonirosea aquatica]|uniref:Peptidase M64 n=1 Tax=Salmonirosea aquatica TaxID=2654236 RepID=A0A7C9FPU0_9BACT|nr:peptidase M64 [Cytophagaceae bacterium SJW1-29]
MKAVFDVKILSIFFSLQLVAKISIAQIFPIDSIVLNGDPDKFINFVILGDGYQGHELQKYSEDAKNASNYLLNISPFKEYKNYFNSFAIKVPSAESGTDHPITAPDCPSPLSHPLAQVDTYFNCSFDQANIHRFLASNNYSAINNVLFNNFPLYDQILLLVNSPYYGGSGGGYSVASTDPSSLEVVAHEIGHSFAQLADEYWPGYGYEAPNATQETNPDFIKWKNWIGSSGVGFYQYCCGGVAKSWYKPHNFCKMQYLGYDYCAVCKQAITLSILQKFGTPIASYLPSSSSVSLSVDPVKFKLNLYKPAQNTLRTKWILNGVNIATNKDSILIDPHQLMPGDNSLTVQVLDTTSLIRAPWHEATNTHSVNWTINLCEIPNAAGTIVGSSTICQGQTSINYTIPTIPNSTSYIWTLPIGASGMSSTNTILVDFGNLAVSGDITVRGKNACGEGSAAVFQVAVYNSMQTIKSGNWSDPSVWSCGRVPSSEDDIIISEGNVLDLSANGYARSVEIRGVVNYIAESKIILGQ